MFAARLVSLWIGAFGLAAGAFCQDNIIVFSPSANPTTEVHVAGINEGGMVAGDYVAGEGGGPIYRGFIRDHDGQITVFDPPVTGADIAVYGINSGGAVTGTYAIGTSHGFVRNADGSFVTFDVPGSAGTYPVAINGEGAVTGQYITAVPGSTSGFLRNPDGSFTLFAPRGVYIRIRLIST